jgi:hypothetical protein
MMPVREAAERQEHKSCTLPLQPIVRKPGYQARSSGYNDMSLDPEGMPYR